MKDLSTMNFEKMKLNELKAHCREFKLKMTGKKDDLISRIKKFYFFVRNKIKDQHTHVSKGSEKYKMKESVKFLLNEKGMYQALTLFQKHYFIYDPHKKAVTKKINMKEKLCDLTREDIDYLKCVAISFDLPNVLEGEPNRQRSIVEDEEDDLFLDCNDDDFE